MLAVRAGADGLAPVVARPVWWAVRAPNLYGPGPATCEPPALTRPGFRLVRVLCFPESGMGLGPLSFTSGLRRRFLA